MPDCLPSILSRSLAHSRVASASSVVNTILSASSDADTDAGPQIIIAFRGTSSVHDALVDLQGWKAPLTRAGRFGPHMADDFAKLTPERIDDLIRRGHQQGRSKLSAACRALLAQDGSGAGAGAGAGLGARLLRDAAAHAGFLDMYQSGRQQLLRLLDSPAYRDAAGAFRASLLVCGHSMGGALARLCALNRPLCKLLDLLHPRRDLHVVNHADPIPAVALSYAEGGTFDGCLSALFDRGPYSHPGSLVWLQDEEGALHDPPPAAGAGAGARRRLAALLGGCCCRACCCPGAEPAVSQHHLAHYLRKCAALALRAGVPVRCVFPGSATNPPPPGWARALLAARRGAAEGGGGAGAEDRPVV